MIRRTIKLFCEKLPNDVNVYNKMSKDELVALLNKKDDEINRLHYRIKFLLKTVEDLEKTKN
jgi:hypothetical protein